MSEVKQQQATPQSSGKRMVQPGKHHPVRGLLLLLPPIPLEAVAFGSARLLLLDDSTVWRPPSALRPLWTYMRLLLLESIWVVRCASDGRPFSSASVVSRFRAALQQQLTQDWLRTQGDVRVNSGVPLSWLLGRDPVLQPGRFEAKWQRPGVLYRLEDGQGPRLVLPGASS